uniref:ATP-binding protein n=1 Tax=candidate division WOR-3 bacterium TaxID=2052148 RepID=A0A7V3PSY2_UNCW3
MEKLHSVDIGYVIEVNGERAFVELTADPTRPLGDDYYPGQPGSYVKIPFKDFQIIGTVSSIRMQRYPGEGGGGLSASGRKVAECVLLGTLEKESRFFRGMAIYPNVGQPVQMVSIRELDQIFSEFSEFGFSFGCPSNARGQRVYVQVNRFFGGHIAVLGTTGSGKSCTVATILQRTIKKYPYTHIVVLDLHGEYARAFPEGVNLINAGNIELPYWLLNFDEFVDLTVDVNEPSAKNQLTVLRDSLLRARQAWDTRERLGLGGQITADSPVYYDLDELLAMLRDWNIQMVYNAAGVQEPGPLYGVFDKFLIRMDSRVSDPRYHFMFKPKTYTGSPNFIDLLRDYLSIDAPHQMTIVDLSGVPSDAIGVIVAVVTRIIFEFNLWNPERERCPILLVLEEAHNYVPSRSDGRFTSARAAVERITKEGRKYGIGMIIVSQRPKELSETVLSQCNTFISMRLTNPEDQDYVRRLVPDSLAGLMEMLPALRTGEALILGEAVPMPTRMLIDLPDPKPESGDIEFAKWWAQGTKTLDLERLVKRWRVRRRDI